MDLFPSRAIPVTTALPGHPGWDTQDPGAGGAGGAGTSLPSWPLIPDLAFSAADTEHFQQATLEQAGKGICP